jgi:ElaB/YqjD/DUF883 family membrane-anchored ribosome-binding protein
MPATTSNSDLPNTATGSSTSTNRDIDGQLQQLRSDIASLAKTVAAVGSDKATEAKGRARRAASDAVDSSYQMVEAAKDQAMTWERDLERQIRMKPIQSVAIAAGVGFVFALLSRR